MLTGTLRAKVMKQKKGRKDVKLYIKTRTAAMGVRGTEFVIAMNQENQVTSLVTLEGEVSMTQVDPSDNNVDIKKIVNDSVEVKDAVIVRKGRAATSYLNKEEVSQATKVNPVQLIALKKNKTMLESTKKKVDKVEKIEMTEKLKEELYAPDTEEEIANGTEKIPEKGAFVDLKSAIFIPAAKDKTTDMGAIDANSGSYIPPEGLKLDINKGFVAKADTNLKAKKKADEAVEKLNKHIDYEEVPQDFALGHAETPSSGDSSAGGSWSATSAFSTIVAISGINYQLKDSENKKTDIAGTRLLIGTNYNISRSTRSIYSISAALKSVTLDKAEYDLTTPTIEEEEKEAGFKISLGHSYRIAKDYTISAKAIYEEDFFPLFISDGIKFGIINSRIALPKLQLSLISKLSRDGTIKANYTQIFSGQDETLRVETGKSMGLTYRLGFGQSNSHLFGLGFNISDYFYNDVNIRKNMVTLSYNYRF